MATGWQCIDPYDSDSSKSHDRESSYSNHSKSTAPTEYTQYIPKPQVFRHGTCDGRVEGAYDDWQYDCPDERTSTETYASTVPSEDDFSDNEDVYDVDVLPDEAYQPQAIASTPRDFAELFPSRHRLSIQHDDATLDGNMNLRIDTQVQTRSGRIKPVTLYHLRMHDLRDRKFSLRRYCRDSGREVCHSIRKLQNSSSGKPILQRSWTETFSNFRHKASTSTVFSGLKRNDSGYGSFSMGVGAHRSRHEGLEPDQTRTPTKTVKLEFANYAQVEVSQRGSGSQRRYCFDYWGHDYTWRRHVRQDCGFKEVSYHLIRSDRDVPIAHILPVPVTQEQKDMEKRKGGWIAPCSMWLTDMDVCGSPDVADVIVSTGLITLVDDSIKMKWHSPGHRQVVLPISPSLRMDMEYIGPRRLIDEAFNRRPQHC